MAIKIIIASLSYKLYFVSFVSFIATDTSSNDAYTECQDEKYNDYRYSNVLPFETLNRF